MKRWIVGLVVAVVLAAAALVWWQRDALPRDAAFAVGDDVVTVAELDERIDGLRALYGVQPPTGQPDRMAEFRAKSAKAVAESMVLDRQAAAMGIEITDAQVRTVLDSYLAAQLGPGLDVPEQFVRILGNARTSEKAVLDAIRRQLAVDALFTKVTADVAVDRRAEKWRSWLRTAVDEAGVRYSDAYRPTDLDPNERKPQ